MCMIVNGVWDDRVSSSIFVVCACGLLAHDEYIQ